MKVALLPVILALSACGVALSPRQDDAVVRGRGRALDGDTVAIDFRLSGVDAPERRQMCERAGACYSCGKIAQDATARMLRQGDASIQLVGGMSYGRPVGLVSVGGADIGEALVSASTRDGGSIRYGGGAAIASRASGDNRGIAPNIDGGGSAFVVSRRSVGRQRDSLGSRGWSALS